jgi:hypothetical protein
MVCPHLDRSDVLRRYLVFGEQARTRNKAFVEYDSRYRRIPIAEESEQIVLYDRSSPAGLHVCPLIQVKDAYARAVSRVESINSSARSDKL